MAKKVLIGLAVVGLMAGGLASGAIRSGVLTTPPDCSDPANATKPACATNYTNSSRG
ncbi:hypothetical protein ACFOD9_13035 [Novosphingobium bradum]|uniref:DUF680 domain-containing protein n=1 Tax=Novosphingobium bradum TaxID=1737444 RepID=A0ABV7IWT1_9SPHN